MDALIIIALIVALNLIQWLDTKAGRDRFAEGRYHAHR